MPIQLRASDDWLSLNEAGDPEMLRDVMLAIRRLEFDPELEIHRYGLALVTPEPSGRLLVRNGAKDGEHVIAASLTERSGEGGAEKGQEPRFALPTELAETGLDVWRSPAGDEEGLPAHPALAAVHDPAEIELLVKDAPSPRVAAVLAMLLPGLGHLYAGAVKQATAVFTSVLALGLLGRMLLAAPAGSFPGLDSANCGVLGLALVACAVIVAAGSVSSAYRSAATVMPYGRPWLRRSTLASTIGSLALPGWGQFLNDQPRKGGLFLASIPLLLASILFLLPGSPLTPRLSVWIPFLDPGILPALFAVAGVLAVVAWALSIYDAALIASQHCRSRRR